MKLGGLAGLLAMASGLAVASQVDLVNVAQLSGRGDHACVVKTTGAAECWGSNSSGQLGAGNVGDYRSSAWPVTGLASGVVGIAAALGSHTCAIVSGGAVKCWGANGSGQLGDGTTTDRAAPVDVQGLPGAVVAISGGGSHTCAVLASGGVACWGSNAKGQLGDGTTTDRPVPTVVPGLASIVAVSAALSHTCALAASGGVKCWGNNSDGALGDGTQVQRQSPVDVSGLSSGVASIDTGGEGGAQFSSPTSRSCATMSTGGIKCWGGGQLAPVDMPIGANAVSVAISDWRYFAGVLNSSYAEENRCAVTDVGGVRCWATTTCFGLLGNGGPVSCTLNDVSTGGVPTDVVGLSPNVLSVSIVGTRFACALAADGGVKCWGGAYGGSATPAKEGTSAQSLRLNTPTPSSIAVGGTATLSATACCSSTPIVFSSLTPSVCSVSGNTVTALAGGTCTVAGDQAASALFDAAPQASISITVDPRLAQVITFGPLPALVQNGVGILEATSSSGLPVTVTAQYPCSVAGNVIRADFTGFCFVTASQPGDANYAPAAPAQVQFTIGANTGTQPLIVYAFGGGTGSIDSMPAGLQCSHGTCVANPVAGSSFTLTANADAGSRFSAWTGACTGSGACALTMDTAKSVNAIFDGDTPRLVALSTRGRVDNSNNTLIGGFIFDGAATKTVVVRARGRSLQAAGVAGALPNPRLQLIRASDSSTVASNDTASLADDATIIQAMGYGVSDALEAAVMATLGPGAYTTLVTPADGVAGVGLFEVFEIDGQALPLIGLSTRGQVLTGDNVVIGGFAIQGNAPLKVVVRSRGPSLTAQGVVGALADPVIQLVRASDGMVFTNDDWQQDANASALAASGYAPSDPKEAAMLMTLPPGAYTAIMSGAGGSTGTGIVEVYRVP